MNVGNRRKQQPPAPLAGFGLSPAEFRRAEGARTNFLRGALRTPDFARAQQAGREPSAGKNQS
jgi:hypothetical protein